MLLKSQAKLCVSVILGLGKHREENPGVHWPRVINDLQFQWDIAYPRPKKGSYWEKHKALTYDFHKHTNTHTNTSMCTHVYTNTVTYMPLTHTHTHRHEHATRYTNMHTHIQKTMPIACTLRPISAFSHQCSLGITPALYCLIAGRNSNETTPLAPEMEEKLEMFRWSSMVGSQRMSVS